MAEYLLKDKHFGISDEGFHLLRNGYNYRTFSYSDISDTRIKRGNALKNRLLLLIIGVASLAASIYWILGLVDTMTSEYSGVIYIESFVVPLFPLLIGLYMVIMSLKKETILEVRADRAHRFSLREIQRSGEFDLLCTTLSAKVKLDTLL